jgi:hypothetical protein
VNTLAVKELLVLDVTATLNVSPVFKVNEGFNEPLTTVPADTLIFCNPVLYIGNGDVFNQFTTPS